MAAVVTKKVYLGNSLSVNNKLEASGNGAPALSDDIVQNVRSYPVGSDYNDLTGLAVYRRLAANKLVADWVKLGV